MSTRLRPHAGLIRSPHLLLPSEWRLMNTIKARRFAQAEKVRLKAQVGGADSGGLINNRPM